MKTLLTCLLLASSAFAEADLVRLHAVLGSVADPAVRDEGDFRFASALRAQKLPFCAFVYFAPMLKAGDKHRFHLAAVEQLAQLQVELDDRYLIPSILANNRTPSWDRLPPAALARVHVLSAEVAYRKSKYDDVLALAGAIDPKQPPAYFTGRYLAGLTLADWRNPKADVPASIAALKQIVEAKDAPAPLQGLATLALGRVTYGSQAYAESVAWYAKAAAFPQHKADAVFEGAFAQWQMDDLPGALAAARASTQPEAAVLESQLHFFAMRYPDARKALDRMVPWTPGPSRRFDSVVRLVEQVDREKKLLASNPAWKGTPMATELTTYLDQNAGVLAQIRDRLVANRATEAARTTELYRDQAEIMRFESWVAEGGDVGPAIASLEKIVPKVEDKSPHRAELLFHLAELYREKAVQLGAQPAAAAVPMAEAKRLLDLLLKDYPAYPRRAEVKAVRDAL